MGTPGCGPPKPSRGCAQAGQGRSGQGRAGLGLGRAGQVRAGCRYAQCQCLSVPAWMLQEAAEECVWVLVRDTMRA